jgi:hypothetical protein
MSDSQAYEEVTVTAEGVTVVKRFEEDEFPVPAIAFEFDSAREESVTVRMSDSVPEGIEVEDLGFHRVITLLLAVPDQDSGTPTVA